MTAFHKNLFASLLALTATTALAQPSGYSINSDAPSGDQLIEINLNNGSETVIGPVKGPARARTDVEGLAYDRFDVLWAVDDESLKLFPIDTNTGLVQVQQEAPITGLDSLQGNDFGMTFTCSGDLYVSSVAAQSLYRVTLDGAAIVIGSEGALGANISSIAAFGNPARIFGLGNGMTGNGNEKDNRTLYEISIVDGTASPVGVLGDQASDYFQAGLSFDESGDLWAITDRSQNGGLGSQILLIDPLTGTAQLQSTTTSTGFESLAVAAPGGCLVAGHHDFGPSIPTLDLYGKLAAILLMMLGGIAVIRRQ